MNAIDTAFALVIVVLLGCIGCFAILGGCGIYRMRHPKMMPCESESALCMPSRSANITASRQRPQRRVVLAPVVASPVAAQLPPAMAWDDEMGGWAPPKPQPRRQQTASCWLWGEDTLTIHENSVTYDLAALTARAVPELPPLAPVEVPIEPQEEYGIPVDWPTRVVQPVPLS